jgi:hypothetical protein
VVLRSGRDPSTGDKVTDFDTVDEAQVQQFTFVLRLNLICFVLGRWQEQLP